MPQMLTQVLLWSAALLGAFVVVRGYWFEAPEVRKPVMFAGLVMCSLSVARLLSHEGGAWRWPAHAFILAVTIAVGFMTPRSVWFKLRWVVVGGIGTMGGLLVAMWLPASQMAPVARATMLAFVAGMMVLFLVSLVRLLVRMAATQKALRSAS